MECESALGKNGMMVGGEVLVGVVRTKPAFTNQQAPDSLSKIISPLKANSQTHSPRGVAMFEGEKYSSPSGGGGGRFSFDDPRTMTPFTVNSSTRYSVPSPMDVSVNKSSEHSKLGRSVGVEGSPLAKHNFLDSDKRRHLSSMEREADLHFAAKTPLPKNIRFGQQLLDSGSGKSQLSRDSKSSSHPSPLQPVPVTTNMSKNSLRQHNPQSNTPIREKEGFMEKLMESVFGWN